MFRDLRWGVYVVLKAPNNYAVGQELAALPIGLAHGATRSRDVMSDATALAVRVRREMEADARGRTGRNNGEDSCLDVLRTGCRTGDTDGAAPGNPGQGGTYPGRSQGRCAAAGSRHHLRIIGLCLKGEDEIDGLGGVRGGVEDRALILLQDREPLTEKFPGNPTQSYRSREPLRVTGEVTEWQATPPSG